MTKPLESQSGPFTARMFTLHGIGHQCWDHQQRQLLFAGSHEPAPDCFTPCRAMAVVVAVISDSIQTRAPQSKTVAQQQLRYATRDTGIAKRPPHSQQRTPLSSQVLPVTAKPLPHGPGHPARWNQEPQKLCHRNSLCTIRKQVR